jgi:hypothetical protein
MLRTAVLNHKKIKVKTKNVPLTILQGDFESCADILITSYWLHVELEKNV